MLLSPLSLDEHLFAWLRSIFDCFLGSLAGGQIETDRLSVMNHSFVCSFPSASKGREKYDPFILWAGGGRETVCVPHKELEFAEHPPLFFISSEVCRYFLHLS